MEDSRSKNRAIWGGLLVAVGLLTIVVGLAWKSIVPDSVIWSEEDAKILSKAVDDAHSASIGPGHSHSHDPGSSHEHAETQPELLADAKARLSFENARLERARSLRNSTGMVLSILGVVMCLAGVALQRAVR